MGDNAGERGERYSRAIAKALRWLATHQGEDSAFGLPVAAGVNPIFVTALAYLWGGQPRRALGVLERIRSTFVMEDGALYRPARDKKITDRNQQPYAIGWVVRSASACGALDIAHRCARHILIYQHAGSGGLFGTHEEARLGQGVIDLASTGMGGLAFLATGSFDRARAVGDYLAGWFERQPSRVDRLLCQWHTEKGWLDQTWADTLPDNKNAPLVIGLASPHTDYWMCGILLAFLSELYQVTGDRRYLQIACSVFDFAERSDELGHVCASHKFAWGAARLFWASRDPRHIEGACRAADRLLLAQQPDGHFVHEDYFSKPSDQTRVGDLDVTSQFTAWLSAAAMLLFQGSTKKDADHESP